MQSLWLNIICSVFYFMLNVLKMLFFEPNRPIFTPCFTVLIDVFEWIEKMTSSNNFRSGKLTAEYEWYASCDWYNFLIFLNWTFRHCFMNQNVTTLLMSSWFLRHAILNWFFRSCFFGVFILLYISNSM